MSLYIPIELRRRIMEVERSCCAYCHSAESLMGVTFEIEHILPISAGGATELANLCLSCPTCNRHKLNCLLAIEPESGIEVPLYHPRQQQWTEHFAWNNEAIIVLGKTATGRATIEVLQINRPAIVRLRRYWTILHLHPPDEQRK